MPLLAIHHRPGSFTEGFISFCDKQGIPYKLVDCYSSDVINQLLECDALLWHWGHADLRAAKSARQITASLEAAGVPVFPNLNTCWHYDDKVGQKYLLEAVKAPLVPSHVFLSRNAALEWVEKADYPLVFKLRGGAGSENVRLVANKRIGRRLVRRSFGRGWRYHRWGHVFSEALSTIRREPSLRNGVLLARAAVRTFIPRKDERRDVDQGYCYFQDYISDNDHDIRVVVIGDRAFAIKRMTRANDFRASGSGIIQYEKALIPERAIQVAFDVTRSIKSQCAAYDFIFKDGKPLIIEVGYAFSSGAYRKCPGYWTSDMCWHDGEVDPERFIMESFLGERGVIASERFGVQIDKVATDMQLHL